MGEVRSAGLDSDRAAFRWRLPAAAIAAFMALVAFLPVLSSHIADADGYLVHVSAVAGFDRVTTAQVYTRLAARYAADHPGAFPLGALPLALWLIDPHFGLPKLVQYALLVVSFMLFAAIVCRLLGSREAAIAAVAIAVCAWQFRSPHDPVIGTSLVTLWPAVLVLTSWWSWLVYRESRHGAWLALAALATIAASLADVTAWGLACVVAVAALFTQVRARWVLLAVLAATTAASWITRVPSLPWRHGGAYVANVAAQIVAALPASFRAAGYLPIGHVPALYHNGVRYIDDRFIAVPAMTLWMWFTVFTIAALLYYALTRAPQTTAALPRHALLFGAGLWLVPAAMLGSPAQWRAGLPLGQAFDGVCYEYFGVGLLAAFGVMHVLRGNGTAARLTPALVTLAAFIALYGNARADAVVLSRFARVDAARSVIERAGAAGFFARLPEGSTIAVDPSLPFADGVHHRLSDATYAIFHYTKRRYAVVSASTLPRRPAGKVWILRTPRRAGIVVSLSRWTGSVAGTPLVDRALGFTPFATLWDSTPRPGIASSVTALRDGSAIAVRRTCGAVPLREVFARARPRLTWASGFYDQGPVGYRTAPPALTPLGEIAAYPKMFMAQSGRLLVHPSACAPAVITMSAIAVSASPATLTIVSSDGQHERVAISPQPSVFSLHFDMRTAHAPIVLSFSTDAPEADLDPIAFHYERDKPRHLHLVFAVQDVREAWPAR